MGEIIKLDTRACRNCFFSAISKKRRTGIASAALICTYYSDFDNETYEVPALPERGRGKGCGPDGDHFKRKERAES